MEGVISDDEGLSALDSIEDLRDMAQAAPVIRLVNNSFREAINQGASDIHISPYEEGLEIRFRVDGILRLISTVSKKYQAAIISRIKIMSNLDIAERRIPQDGRIRLKMDHRDFDIRVAVTPTVFGEGVVMRILDKSSIQVDIADVGFEPAMLETWLELIHRPNGVILVTGPTGSGKTTTLYASLNHIKSPEIKLITTEDPVEYQLHGVDQIQVNSKVGLTFASALRSILRQDPDVIMVGEIRDYETAEIATQSALTGHLVLSTLHTNDAPHGPSPAWWKWASRTTSWPPPSTPPWPSAWCASSAPTARPGTKTAHGGPWAATPAKDPATRDAWASLSCW